MDAATKERALSMVNQMLTLGTVMKCDTLSEAFQEYLDLYYFNPETSKFYQSKEDKVKSVDFFNVLEELGLTEIEPKYGQRVLKNLTLIEAIDHCRAKS